MIDGKRVLCVIPARAGSKGVPGKNTRLLAGRPLVAYTFDCARECVSLDRVIVSTDSPDVADLARAAGIDVPFMRPAELATDQSGTIDVLLHTMRFVEQQEGAPYDLVLLLHATCPFRLPEDVDACLGLVAEDGAESAFTVSRSHGNPYFNMVEVDSSGVRLSKSGDFACRQDAPDVYDINGAAYAWTWDALERARAVILPGSRVHVMPRERSVDIDDELDFRIAECLMAGGRERLRTTTHLDGL